MKFNLGRTLITANAQEQLAELDVKRGLDRHSQCDFGIIESDSIEINNEAIEEESGNVMSVYTSSFGLKFWIITNFAGDETYTTVLMPEDY
jgi:hypothetical protein